MSPAGGAGPGEPAGQGRAYDLVKQAVDSILAQNDRAERAYRALGERGFSDAEAREQIARVLLAVMYHVGEESDRYREAGGGEALRAQAFRRLAEGETASDIFES